MGTSWPFGDSMVSFDVVAGLSNRAADLDNVIKPVLDTFQSIYEEFNDNKVYEIHLTKEIVPKGDEYLEVSVCLRTDRSEVSSASSGEQEVEE